MNILEVNKLRVSSTRGATTRPLLGDASFSVEQGQIVAIVGPNGAGKSSLLKVLSGEHLHYSGEITFNGKDLRDWKPSLLAQCRAILPQQSSLSFPYTVREVVALGRVPHRTGHRYDSETIDVVIEAMDLNALQCRSYTQLSGGEKQRCQLARILAQIWLDQKNESEKAHRPLLLLDEPLNGLDLGHQQQVLKLLRKLAQKGTTILLVLHDLNRALHIADKVLLLNRGQIAASGKPESVLNESQLSEIFCADIKICSVPNGARKWIVS